MNAKLSTREYGMRDMMINAIAATADPCDARGVLRIALSQLSEELLIASAACEVVGPGGKPLLQNTLQALGHRASAMAEFFDANLAVNFTTSAEGES